MAIFYLATIASAYQVRVNQFSPVRHRTTLTFSSWGTTPRAAVRPLFSSEKEDEEEDEDEDKNENDFPSMFEGSGTTSSGQDDLKKPVNLARGGEQIDAKWEDSEMAANTQFSLSWWAWALVIFPVLLLANDFFHFLPEGGLLSLWKN